MTKDAEKFVKSKLILYRSELECILNGGDISQYNYCGFIHNRNIYEVHDKNYENRLRIALALWYMSEGLDVEALTVVLLNEEIKYLENSPCGGTSRTLFLLLMKLYEYRKPSFRKLFKRARNANMDCFFECDIDVLRKSSKRLSNWRMDDWDYIFELLNDEISQKIFKNLEKSKE